MKENDPELDAGETSEEDPSVLLEIGLPLLALMIVTAALYLAANILIPLATALVLGVVLSPIAGRLERWVGHFFSAGLVVLTGVAAIAMVTYLISVELITVTDKVAGYSENIGNKLAAVEKSTPQWLQHTKIAVAKVTARVEHGNSDLTTPPPVPAVTISSGFFGNVEHFMPALAAVVEILLVIVLLFFLLYSRRDLRDRFVRLAARVRLNLPSHAIESAGQAVGRYLLLLSVINLGYGVAIGVALWALGLPNPQLWGLLAFLFRFIPYVGTLVSSLLPALVALALFPGWSRTLEVLGAMIVLDQVAVHLVEPFTIGPGIDMSPVALLVSTMYWSWLWGLPGLLLAIPLTACLKTAGEHIPALSFFALLLGGERILESYHDFYRLLLEMDSSGARTLALRYCDENGLEKTFDDILAPALSLTGMERAERHISEDNQNFIFDFVRELIPDLGSRFYQLQSGPKARVLGVCPPGEFHSFGLLMVLELFRGAGAAVKFAGEDKSIEEVRDVARLFSPDVVCLSSTLTECLPAAVELIAALRHAPPPAHYYRRRCGRTLISGRPARRGLFTDMRDQEPDASRNPRTDGKEVKGLVQVMAARSRIDQSHYRLCH